MPSGIRVIVDGVGHRPAWVYNREKQAVAFIGGPDGNLGQVIYEPADVALEYRDGGAHSLNRLSRNGTQPLRFAADATLLPI